MFVIFQSQRNWKSFEKIKPKVFCGKLKRVHYFFFWKQQKVNRIKICLCAKFMITQNIKIFN